MTRDRSYTLGGATRPGPVPRARPDSVFDWPGYGRGLAGLARPGETLRIEPGRAVTARVGDLVAFGLAGAYAWNISHRGFGMHPSPAFHYLA